MKRKAYMSKNAGCTGPYSHAVDTGEYIFLSGQTPIDPATGEVVKGGITEQTKQSFKNLLSILDEMGMSEEDSAPYPTRTTVGVTGLCGDAFIEIELIAKK